MVFEIDTNDPAPLVFGKSLINEITYNGVQIASDLGYAAITSFLINNTISPIIKNLADAVPIGEPYKKYIDDGSKYATLRIFNRSWDMAMGYTDGQGY